ncbi:MAG: hypothetical protein FWC34_09185 [Bacteroidetes bacterium]|nr:hypothetical protein [Bacteroidota bacterium]MCL2303028.1 hypothetical protein [Lentimicrobiaceae bacterium]
MDENLFLHFESIGALSGLTELQLSKFEFACEKAVEENPNLGFDDLCIACGVYLNFIISFPELDLGPVLKQIEHH